MQLFAVGSTIQFDIAQMLNGVHLGSCFAGTHGQWHMGIYRQTQFTSHFNQRGKNFRAGHLINLDKTHALLFKITHNLSSCCSCRNAYTNFRATVAIIDNHTAIQ